MPGKTNSGIKGWLKGLLFFMLSFLAFPGCKKDNLPNLTYDGSGLFACKVNGKVFKAAAFDDFSTGMHVPAVSGGFIRLGSDKNHIYIAPAIDRTKYLELFIQNNGGGKYPQPGIYALNEQTIPVPLASSADYPFMRSYGCFFPNTTNAVHTGWIELLKADSATGIISGRFEFEVYDVNNNKSYYLTEGIFDFTSE